MTNRLFVDCDMTLVLWEEDHINQDKSLWVRDKHSFNQELIDFVMEFLHEHPDWTLVVWSGGGIEYAAKWADRCFGTLYISYLVAAKDMRIPEDNDILIDDMEGEMQPSDPRVRVFPPNIKDCPVCK